MADTHERATKDEEAEGAAGGEADEADGEEGRREHEAQGDVAAREQPRGHGARHAREAEGPRDDPELPVGQATRAGDLGKHGAEGAHQERVAEDHQAEQRGAAQGVNGRASPKG